MEPVERVRQERRRRGWSIRKAATQGGVSNTLWARYERGEVGVDESDAMRRAIPTAFGWPSDWETVERLADDGLLARIAAMEAQLTRLDDLEARVKRMAAQLLALGERTMLPDDDELQRPDGSRAVP